MKVLMSLVALVGVVTVHSSPLEANEVKARADTCNCGWINKGRIVGGTEAKKNQYPLIVALEDPYKNQLCGGTILTEWHVVTAAHCTYGEKASYLRVRVGAHDLSKGEGTVYHLSKIINHEKYDDESTVNDISLLVTKTKIKFSQNVGPACLPSKRLSLTGQRLTALGWGDLKDKGQSSDTLQEVSLKVIDFNKCVATWKGEDVLPQKATNLCTFETNKDTCQGDSGGPLLWLNPKTKRLTLAALVSYGGPCAGDLASPNTDVTAFLEWINKNIKASKPGVSACVKE